jgi:hypothetical protein
VRITVRHRDRDNRHAAVRALDRAGIRPAAARLADLIRNACGFGGLSQEAHQARVIDGGTIVDINCWAQSQF